MLSNGISVFFRYLNFISFIGVVLYFFYKKSVPKIRQHIEEKKSLEHIQHNNYEQLIQKEYILKQQLKDQEDSYNILLDKVRQWQDAVEKDQKKILQEYETIARANKQKVAIQEKNQSQKRLEMSVIPRALADARLQLSNAFSIDENEKEYVHVLLNQIQKSIQ